MVTYHRGLRASQGDKLVDEGRVRSEIRRENRNRQGERGRGYCLERSRCHSKEGLYVRNDCECVALHAFNDQDHMVGCKVVDSIGYVAGDQRYSDVLVNWIG